MSRRRRAAKGHVYRRDRLQPALSASDSVQNLDTAKEDAKGVDHTEILIYSDLIENSDFLGGGKFFGTPNSVLLSDLRAKGLIASLPRTQVRVAGVGRAGTADRRPLTVGELEKLEDFWKQYFAAGGASIEIGQHLGRLSN